ncbi:tyrosine phosphatase [Fusarium pseudoanthophilum]|uniref:protein-tyrosine-phosphatase n=1 Tax=Fusarium pseudoanthophilum TaxID=48495 RepID=A0A8H5KMH0_9HYPO|nr:tyrosine phosphatase [Fusarium pseudoanthophilum]
MPSVTDRRVYEDQIPPFMTVFDLDAETMADQDTVTLVDTKFVDMEPKRPGMMGASPQHGLGPSMIPVDSTHKHHDSTSTQTSESADSSPTTTLSTTDSSPLSDASPSSSPDSPMNLIPLNNYPATSFGNLSTNLSSTATTTLLSEPPRLQRPMTSPSPRRGRNMKGLSIQPPFAASTSTTNISLVSEPSSPSFIKPTIPAMRRKPSQLSLKTNTSDLIHKTTLEVPPSPAMPMLQRRALKHSCSSPHMSSGLKSATFGPPGGMTFPKVLERNESGLSEVLRPTKSSLKPVFHSAITEEDSPIRTQMAIRDDDPYRDNENNEDMKTPGYPDGPIAIYGDNVFLYSEPTADEASRFDVVINCAREVSNPFEFRKVAHESQSQSPFQSMQRPVSGVESPIPDTAVSTASFMTAWEYPQEDSAETPTTPKAFQFKEPEYIHIPWDHNTDIAPDLMELCDVIDKRTKAGKRVLIHCQQGASRSASLIIAYGLFQKPHLTVNDAYYAAQAKSQWISPNMKLMYSLQDFQKEVSTKRTALPSHRPRPGRSPSKHRITLSVDAIDIGAKEPQTAPLPTQNEELKDSHLNPSPNRLRGNSTPGPRPVSPGPASAPPTCTWKDEVEQHSSEHLDPLKLSDLPKRPVSSQGKAPPTLAPSPMMDSIMKPPPSPGFPSQASLGFQTMTFPRFNPAPSEMRFSDAPVERTITLPGSYPDDNALLSPRAETMTNNPLHDVHEVAGMRFVESPPTPSQGLFSPRAGMFPRDPFSTFGRPPVVADPRSPPTKGEAPIIRSIDDLL